MKKLRLDHITKINYSLVEELLSKFLKEYLAESAGKGYIVGVSGGLDSATALALSVKSVGADKVIALIMPDKGVTPEEDVEDAVNLAEKLRVKYHIIDISKAVEYFKNLIPIYEDDEKDKLPLGNLRARIRMCILYYYANKVGYLVLGSTDRSEYLIGYFTKYGDGATDVAPLAILYKTQVREFAKYLGVPQNIALKPSAPRLWRNHVAEKELGVKYEDIDLVLAAYVDLGIHFKDIPKVTGIDVDIVDKVLHMYVSSIHKRKGLVIPSQHIFDVVRNMVVKNTEK
ncbi:MAG: NAD+ synthase [Ignisphaera sp.]